MATHRRTLVRVTGSIGLHLILVAGALLMLFPFLWTVSSSFKDIGDIFNYPPSLWPASPTTENYTDLFSQNPFLRWYLNSIGVATASTVISVLLSALAGFGFAKYEFRGRGFLFKLLIGTLIVPFQLVLVPLFYIVSKLGWLDSYQALIVPFMALPSAFS